MKEKLTVYLCTACVCAFDVSYHNLFFLWIIFNKSYQILSEDPHKYLRWRALEQ